MSFHYRALFLSDLHLGARASRPQVVLDFLRQHSAETIYLVGDIFDLWHGGRIHWHHAHDAVAAHFDEKGGRTLLLGKMTHSAGAAVLVAAGLARMPALRFGWINLVATVPKSLLFVTIGYGFGSAYARIDNWISRASLVLLGLIVLAGVAWAFNRGNRK